MALSYFNLSNSAMPRLPATREQKSVIIVPTPTRPNPYLTFALSSPSTSIAGLILKEWCPRLPQRARSQQLRSLVSHFSPYHMYSIARTALRQPFHQVRHRCPLSETPSVCRRSCLGSNMRSGRNNMVTLVWQQVGG